MPSPSLNLCQQAFVLSHESNNLGDKQQTGRPSALANQLRTHLNDFLGNSDTQNAMGNWALAWGPVVFAKDPSDTSTPDNVMYVAANADQSVYVVAIAGTDFQSHYDVATEDNNTLLPVSWKKAFPSLGKYGVPSDIKPTPQISVGTAAGVNALLSMNDPDTHQSLVTFLGSLGAKSSKTLIFTGHSLGGALSPTLALALFNPVGGQLSTANWGHVYVLPTAGPTPGNQGFATFFKQVFPPVSMNLEKPYYAWNQNIWNSLDAVPHAWHTSLLEKILDLYQPKWPLLIPPPLLLAQVEGAIVISNLFGFLAGPYALLPNIMVPGTLTTPAVTDTASFMHQVGYQHIDAYNQLFEVDQVISKKSQEGLRTSAMGLMSAFQKMAEKNGEPTAAEGLLRSLEKQVRKAG
ncbi:MAG TPA: hypothetical protein VEY88_05080 [Archangium sp.]|nr:hypothetical protein [Archangium sp.]